MEKNAFNDSFVIGKGVSLGITTICLGTFVSPFTDLLPQTDLSRSHLPRYPYD
jgi:hypothetical protein